MKFMHKPVNGLRLTQNINIDKSFKALKKIFYPEIIIEIGTHYGGFAAFLRQVFESSDIHTFDISDWGDVDHRDIVFRENNIIFHKEDAHDINIGAKTIIELIKNKKTLILCDGGHKVNEFTRFGPYLKKGDCIGAHDYGKTKQYYKKHILNKLWTASHEVEWNDLSGFCSGHGLNPIMEDIFTRSVWLMCMKSY